MRRCSKCDREGNFAHYIIEGEIVCNYCSPYSNREKDDGFIPEYTNKTETNPQSGSNANAAGKHNYPSERKSR